MSNKRQRSNSGQAVQRRAKRPIDKHFANVSIAALGAAQVNTTILAAMTYPGTITGLRWDLNFQRNAGANAAAEFKWAIVLVPQNTTASTLTQTSGSSLYDPEQNVLVYGTGISWNIGDPVMKFTGETSTMRKLKTGDTVLLVALGTLTNTHLVSGTTMFFVKS